MLELIVLGQIPGTGWQLSFIGMLLFGVLAMLLAKSLRSYYRYHKFTTRFARAAHYFVLVNKKPAKKRA